MVYALKSSVLLRVISANNYISQSLVMLLLVSIMGCGMLEQAHYYTAVPTDARTQTTRWGDGVALLSESMCLWIAEGDTKDYRPLSMGPIGLPVIPLQLPAKNRQESALFKLELWLVPDLGQDGYSFDPKSTRVRFENSIEVNPVTVQVSRFKTYGRQESGLFTMKSRERIATPDHWNNKLAKEFSEPVALWDWSRFIMTFEKPAKEIAPVSLVIPGIAKHGKEFDAIELRLKSDSDTRYLYPGKTGDNTPVGGSPGDICRELFKSAMKK